MNERVDVVVVGLGPVGAVMAQLLAQAGLFVVAVDMSPTIYDKPRAVGIDHESLRILQQLGITDALAPFLGGYRPSEYHSASGEVLRSEEHTSELQSLMRNSYAVFCLKKKIKKQ